MKIQIATYKSFSIQTKIFKDEAYTAVCRPFPWTNNDPMTVTGPTPDDARNKLIKLIEVLSASLFEELDVREYNIQI